MGNCVIGGYVYHGTQFAKELGGKYIFGDNGSGRLWAMTWDGTNAPAVNYLCNMPPGVNHTGLSSFVSDEKNELYMLKMGRPSKIYKLVQANTPRQPISAGVKLPQHLSETRAFADLAHLKPAAGITPYDVNSPLWSDGAAKQRWIAVPGNEKITFSASNSFSFPVGTVFIKNFDLAVNETNGTHRRLETRFLVRNANGRCLWRHLQMARRTAPTPSSFGGIE